jgi:serine/threonine-protein kinase
MMGDALEERMNKARTRLGGVLKEKWRLDDVIGVGGMATVYSATHRNNGKRVAVKMLHPELSVIPQIRTRFLREGYASNQVDHPGVVSVLDDDVSKDGSVFLVMELLEGETLEQRRAAAGGRIDLLEVLWATDQLLDVLALAHTKGIIHRDIKPENLFITRKATLKVLDFGLARVRPAQNKPGLTRTNMLMGTLDFMPPEQAMGQWDDVGARADLWSVGATMFMLLTGRPVHEGRTVEEQIKAVSSIPPRSIGLVRRGLPPPVVALIDRALAFKPEDRWPDATRMQEAVRDAYIRVGGGAAAPQSIRPAASAPEEVVVPPNAVPKLIEPPAPPVPPQAAQAPAPPAPPPAPQPPPEEPAGGALPAGAPAIPGPAAPAAQGPTPRSGPPRPERPRPMSDSTVTTRWAQQAITDALDPAVAADILKKRPALEEPATTLALDPTTPIGDTATPAPIDDTSTPAPIEDLPTVATERSSSLPTPRHSEPAPEPRLPVSVRVPTAPASGPVAVPAASGPEATVSRPLVAPGAPSVPVPVPQNMNGVMPAPPVVAGAIPAPIGMNVAAPQGLPVPAPLAMNAGQAGPVLGTPAPIEPPSLSAVTAKTPRESMIQRQRYRMIALGALPILVLIFIGIVLLARRRAANTTPTTDPVASAEPSASAPASAPVATSAAPPATSAPPPASSSPPATSAPTETTKGKKPPTKGPIRIVRGKGR